MEKWRKNKGIGLKLCLLAFLIPLLLIIKMYLDFSSFGLNALLAYLLFFVIIISALVLLKNNSLFNIYFLISNIFFLILVFIDYFHVTVFDNPISESTLYIIFETNSSESSEFLLSYLKLGVILLLVFSLSFTITSFILITTILKHPYKPLAITKKTRFSIVIILCISSLFIVKLRHSFLPFIIFKSTIKFYTERQQITKIKFSKNGTFKNVSHISDNQEELYVMVIGESTTRNHLGLYGYERNNNPLLCELDLKVFKNVISPHSHTITSLSKVLTLGDYNIPEKKYNNTIVQLFNSAGFETNFISNQKPVGIYETATTLLTKMSKYSYFKNTLNNNTYDHVVLKVLDEVLKKKKQKKFIVLHLMGTHRQYNKRYPDSFNFFKNTPKTQFKHELAYKTINEYDNAILYNDYIVYEIIKRIRKKNVNSFVLYFSDHGEDVYETINEACHTEEKGTKPMFEIPFMLWQSKKNKKQTRSLLFDLERNYNTENLIHSVSELSKIKFDRFDESKSIFQEID